MQFGNICRSNVSTLVLLSTFNYLSEQIEQCSVGSCWLFYHLFGFQLGVAQLVFLKQLKPSTPCRRPTIPPRRRCSRLLVHCFCVTTVYNCVNKLLKPSHKIVTCRKNTNPISNRLFQTIMNLLRICPLPCPPETLNTLVVSILDCWHIKQQMHFAVCVKECE